MMTRTMDGYIRVSRRMGREGPGYISPKVQREAIERWADYKGVTIAQWHVDEDESGGTHDRPGLEAAVERAVSGECGGIVSWKIDRFSRFTEGGLRDLRRLQDAGADLAFVVEDIDTSGPMGRFVYTILLAVGELFLETIKAGWIVAKTKAIARGAHIARAPLGYVKRDDGTLAVDPHSGPVVTKAFELAARDGLAATVAFLNEAAPARTWNAFTTRRFLGNRTYLGVASYGDLVCEDAHEPLVSRRTFEIAQHTIGEAIRVRARADVFPLSGVAQCGTCGTKLIGARGGNDARRMYRCSAHASCAAPVATSAEPLEAHVTTVLREAFEHPGFQVGEPDPSIDAKVVAVQDAERELDAFASDLTGRKLLGERYHRHLQERVEAVSKAQSELAAVASRPARVVLPAELWDELTVSELAMVLRAGLQTVVVDRGRGPLSGRVRVVPKGLDVGAIPATKDV